MTNDNKRVLKKKLQYSHLISHLILIMSMVCDETVYVLQYNNRHRAGSSIYVHVCHAYIVIESITPNIYPYNRTHCSNTPKPSNNPDKVLMLSIYQRYVYNCTYDIRPDGHLCNNLVMQFAMLVHIRVCILYCEDVSIHIII